MSLKTYLDHIEHGTSVSREMIEQAKPHISLLIAEDDEFIRDLYQIILSDTYELHMVIDGRDAINAINEPGSIFDIVMTDGKMPYANGTDVIKTAYEIGMKPHQVIIASSEPNKYTGGLNKLPITLTKIFSARQLNHTIDFSIWMMLYDRLNRSNTD